jgi:hypothetical protein
MGCDGVGWRATGWMRAQRRVPLCDAIAVFVFFRELVLYNNQLSGSIPSTLGNLIALR